MDNKCKECHFFDNDVETGYVECVNEKLDDNKAEMYMSKLNWFNLCPGFKERKQLTE